MEEQHEKDPLTYEQLQHLIDQQLAHLDEIQTQEESKIEGSITSTGKHKENDHQVKGFWSNLKGLWNNFKDGLAKIFRHA